MLRSKNRFAFVSRFIGAVCLLATVVSGHAQSVTPDVANSVEWQKVRLENYITEQVDKNLSSFLSRQQYVILTSLKVKSDSASSQSTTSSGQSAATAADSSTGPSKLGLDNQTAQMIAQVNLGDDKNVFKRISSIEITIMFDKGVPKDKVDLALKVTDRFLENTVGKKAKTKFEMAALVQAPPPAEKKAPLKEFIFEYKDIVAIVAGALVLIFGFIFVTNMAFGKLGKFEGAKLKAFEAFIATQKDKSETTSSGNANEAAHATAHAADDHSSHGTDAGSEDELKSSVEKYKSLFNVNFSSASLLFKQWIKSKSPVALNAVSLISHEFTHVEWAKLLPELDASSKKQLKKVSNQDLNASDRIDALKFLSAQVLDSYLEAPVEMDRKQLEKLLSLSESECVQILTKEPKLGSVLLSMLPQGVVGNVLDLLSDDIAVQVTLESAQLESADIQVRATELAGKLETLLVQSKTKLTPFIERSGDLMSSVSPAREAALFKAIVASKNYMFLQETAERFFPSQLVPKLPAETLKNALLRMSDTSRIEFIAGQREDFQKSLVSSVGEPGKKLRDVLDFELADLAKNEIRKNQALAKAPKLYREFAMVVRMLMRADEQVREEGRTLLRAWYLEVSGGAFDGAQGTADNVTPITRKAA